jgi:hypothetical protein
MSEHSTFVKQLKKLYPKDGSGCHIINFNCNDVNLHSIIKWLSIISTQQSQLPNSGFESVFPWDYKTLKQFCFTDQTFVIYISLSIDKSDTIYICGWMTTIEDKNGDIYIHELTSRVKSIGTSLVNTAYDKLDVGNKLYLNPIDMNIYRNFYKKKLYFSVGDDGYAIKVKTSTSDEKKDN